MIGRFVRDESGMTMGLAVIMVVLIGVMGAGLLTFASADLRSVVEVNQGQRALEVADAGVQAAKRQLISDTTGNNAPSHYDGGANELPWSYCYDSLTGSIPGCTGISPTPTGSPGMRVNMGDDYARVTILATDQSAETYRVISEGHVGEARRKVEAILRQKPAVSTPPAYFTRGDITLTGNSTANGVSFFALGNIDVGGSFSLGTQPDFYFGKWAATTGSYSYSNTYNETPRPSELAGVGAQGVITGDVARASEGSRSFDRDSTPYQMVPDYQASILAPGSKIAFPFKITTPAEDRDEIEVLRQRALALERANPGVHYYIDSNPGNGVDDAGLANGLLTIDPWPAGSDYETVVFYEYAQYNSANTVNYRAGAVNCGTTTNRGAIVVVNGDVQYNSNRRFDGAIIIRAYDPSTGALMPDVGGLYKGNGNPCLHGYVNASGDMVISGNINPGPALDMSSLNSYRGSIDVLSWRELYQ